MTWLNTNNIGDDAPECKTIIAVDFDGTLVENEFPALGSPNPGAIEVLQELRKKGVRLILNTMRVDHELNDAIAYCNRNNIDFFGINENPEQEKWTTSKKLFAHVYIDDRGAGTPLRKGSNNEACVDWEKLRDLFVSWDLLEPIVKEDDGTKTFEL